MADRTALETLQEQSCVTWTPVQVSMPIYFHFQKLPWTLQTLFEMNLVPERQLVEISNILLFNKNLKSYSDRARKNLAKNVSVVQSSFLIKLEIVFCRNSG